MKTRVRADVGDSRLLMLSVNGVLLLMAILSLAPLAWMVSVSFMPAGQANTFPPPLLPNEPTLQAYRELFQRMGMGRYLLNSVLVSLAITLVSLLLNAMAGYAFAKLRFAGRERLFRLLLAALVVPAQVAMLPLFLLMRELGLVNSLAGVVIPALATVFGIFLVRQYARSIPDELIEAARLDGAGEWRIFFTIVLPLLKPVLATLAVFTFMTAWNDFMWPLIVLTGCIGITGARLRHGDRNDDGRRSGDGIAGPTAVCFVAALLHPRVAAGQFEGLDAGATRSGLGFSLVFEDTFVIYPFF